MYSHRGDSLTSNNKPHTHESKPGILTNVLITKKIIETAKADIFTSAPTVVEKILEEDADPKKNRICQTKLQQHSQDCKQTSADRPSNRAPRYEFRGIFNIIIHVILLMLNQGSKCNQP